MFLFVRIFVPDEKISISVRSAVPFIRQPAFDPYLNSSVGCVLLQCLLSLRLLIGWI